MKKSGRNVTQKKHTDVKQAAKKKQKGLDARKLRFKNAALRDSLDKQAHLLYTGAASNSEQAQSSEGTTDRDLASIIGNL